MLASNLPLPPLPPPAHPPSLGQVKDLLPDYGDGFIAACLQQLGGSPERVLNALLEGSLPAPLAGMDTQLSLEAWQAAADRTGPQDKGKRPVGQAAGGSYDADFPATLPAGSGRAGAASTAGAAGAAQPRAEDKTARYLDVREETYREALVSAANAAQVGIQAPRTGVPWVPQVHACPGRQLACCHPASAFRGLGAVNSSAEQAALPPALVHSGAAA